MGGRRACLGSTNVQDARLEIDLISAQVDQFGRPEAVAEGQQDHRRVPMARGRVDQALDFGLGEVLVGPILSVRPATRVSGPSAAGMEMQGQCPMTTVRECLSKAAEFESRAAIATDRQLKATFKDLARLHRQLATGS
jgi:hypothetical protein